MHDTAICPDCKAPLEQVRHSRDSYLNADQFAAVRAGDWFCETCPGNGRGNTQYRYFWDHELSANTRIQRLGTSPLE